MVFVVICVNRVAGLKFQQKLFLVEVFSSKDLLHLYLLYILEPCSAHELGLLKLYQ